MRLPLRPGWICLLAVAIAGCKPSPEVVPEPERPISDFGRFEGEVVAVWEPDGRKMTLREDFTYFDPRGHRWLAPTGAAVDGASIPRLFWTVIGGPFEGKYRNASVVHDIGCVEMQQPWEDVHRMFYEACRCSGVDETQAKMMYYAVHHFGPRWQRIVENVIEQVADATGKMVDQEVTVQHTVRIDPPPPTPDELEQVQAFIAEDDPEPLAIERFNRDSLHRRPRRGREGPPRTAADDSSPGERHDSVHKPHRSADAPPSRRTAPDRSSENQQGRWSSSPGAPPRGAPPLGQDEQEWATQIVRQYLEQQAGASRPAEYRVERGRGGFRVLVQFLHEDDQGQMVPYIGGTCIVRISRDGQVLESVSGSE